MNSRMKQQISKNKAHKIGKQIDNSIAKSLTKRLERNRPIRDKQTLYPWLIRHIDGVRLALAVRN
ncbi:hypothetical protein T4D_14395 [Trichinella pseudospiralis]|uniref:Uncharacterized protein n=1 Tax=Trichinella pseudospiralis TaxID=6337 RepID=A0A0V1F4E1_TRIPS|nr:hypothetical protein T4D_14395 [Trichinella pseudospiralis]